MHESVKKRLEKLESLRTESLDECEVIRELLKEFPDLQIHTNRWGRRRYSAKSANARVDQFDCGFNCGCCDDSPLEIWPYLEVNGIEVHSSPTGIMVGDRWDSDDEYRRVSAYAGWKDKFISAGINQKVIDKVEEYLRLEAPEEYPYEYEEAPPPDPPKVRIPLTVKRAK